jgi:hypothetical protein
MKPEPEVEAPVPVKPLRRPFEAVASGSQDVMSPLRVPKSDAFRKMDYHSKMDDETDDENPKKRAFMISSPRKTFTNAPSASLNAYGIPINNSTATAKSLTKPDLNDRIRVCLRKRPLNKKELAKKETDVAIVTGRRTIHFYEPKYLLEILKNYRVKVDLTKYVETHEFVFDEAFDADASNDDVFTKISIKRFTKERPFH